MSTTGWTLPVWDEGVSVCKTSVTAITIGLTLAFGETSVMVFCEQGVAGIYWSFCHDTHPLAFPSLKCPLLVEVASMGCLAYEKLEW